MIKGGEVDSSDESAQHEDDVAKANEAKRLQREREVEDFKWLMANRQGRRFMWRLLGMTRLHQTPHQMGARPEDNAFRAGAQNIGLGLQAEIHALCPEQYTVMVKEQRELKNARSRDKR